MVRLWPQMALERSDRQLVNHSTRWRCEIVEHASMRQDAYRIASSARKLRTTTFSLRMRLGTLLAMNPTFDGAIGPSKHRGYALS